MYGGGGLVQQMPPRTYAPRTAPLPSAQMGGGGPPSRVLYVGNLPLDVTEEELLREFSVRPPPLHVSSAHTYLFFPWTLCLLPVCESPLPSVM